jgi:ATP-dependent helicase/DNAse subunit B
MGTIHVLSRLPEHAPTVGLLDRYRDALTASARRGEPGACLWLAPTRAVQLGVVERLVEGQPGLAAPNVMTFDAFAERILTACFESTRLISPVLRRVLLRKVVADAVVEGELPEFAGIAETSGFLGSVLRFIDDCKRSEVWPENLKKWLGRRRDRSRLRQLLAIYERYQAVLLEHNWYDQPGRFWLAMTRLPELIEAGRIPWRVAVVDGFVDFTATQYDLLALLATVIDEVWVSLPLPRDPDDRSDLFVRGERAANSLRTAAEKISRKGAAVQVVRTSPDRPAPDRPAGIDVLRRGLFTNPRQWQPGDQADGVELYAAVGADGEHRLVARAIKEELASGTRPSRIVVCTRGNAEREHWERALGEAGLPVWSDVEMPLRRRPAIRAVLELLNCEAADWPYELLMGVLDRHDARKADELGDCPVARAVGRLLRELRLDRGRAGILESVARYRARRPNDVAARVVDETLQRLDHSLASLRSRGTLHEWSDRLARIMREHIDTSDTRDRNDVDLFQRLLRDAASAEQQLHAGLAPNHDLPTLLQRLTEFLGNETVSRPGLIPGSIAILEPEDAIALDCEVLFVAGLSESSFPSRERDDSLFRAADRDDLCEAGLPLPQARDLQHGELLLFHELVTRPSRRLVLSYPAMNRRGQELFPSPYVQALRRVYREGVLPVVETGRLDPVPDWNDALTGADLPLVAMKTAKQGQPEGWRNLLELPETRSVGLNLIAAAEAEALRFHTRGWTDRDGQLEHPVNLRELKRRFGPKHQFSATELEAYAECPYRFWLKNLLNVEPLSDLEWRTDHAGRGQIVHDVLRQITDHLDAAADELAERFLEFTDDLLGQKPVGHPLQRALLKIERRLLEDCAAEFGGQAAEYRRRLEEEKRLPTRVLAETPFGDPPRMEGETEGTEPARAPLVLGSSDSPVLIRGRIDRIDVFESESNSSFAVIDYKTGRAKAAQVKSLQAGQGLQLALYTLAVSRLQLGAVTGNPLLLGYWTIREKGFSASFMGGKRKGLLDAKLLAMLGRVLDGLVPHLVEGMRGGRFVVENRDKNCTARCDYRTTCRVSQVRAVAEPLGKVSPPLPFLEDDDATSDEEPS